MINTYFEALEYLFSKRNQNKSNEKLKKIIEENNLTPTYPVCIITGTNGKGEVCHFAKNILKNCMHVGMFTSPHVESFNERIMINDRYISNSEVMYYTMELEKINDKYISENNDSLSFFQLTFLMALMFYKDREIDYGIFEVGIGGINDSVNVLEPELSILVNVGLDHMDILGNTKEEICLNKLGITRDNKTLITSEKELLPLIKDYCSKRNIKLINVLDDLEIINDYEFIYKGNNYKKYIPGYYSAYDASIAIELATNVMKNIPYDFLSYGIYYTMLPSRMEIINNKPLVIIDGGHNKDAVINLVSYLKRNKGEKKILIIYQSLRDKDYKEVIKLLDTVSDSYYITDFDDKRCSKKEDIASCLTKPYKLFNNISDLVSNISFDDDNIIVFSGSFHLSFQVKQEILKKLKEIK